MALTSLLKSYSRRWESVSEEKPRCPPASGPSATIKSAVRKYFLSQYFKIVCAAFPEETIGAIWAEYPAAYLGRAVGRPAPEIIASAPASQAALTYSPYNYVATMIFTPIIADIFFVSKAAGENGLAVMNLIAPIFALIYAWFQQTIQDEHYQEIYAHLIFDLKYKNAIRRFVCFFL